MVQESAEIAKQPRYWGFLVPAIFPARGYHLLRRREIFIWRLFLSGHSRGLNLVDVRKPASFVVVVGLS